jgi:hypothetical protein
MELAGIKFNAFSNYIFIQLMISKRINTMIRFFFNCLFGSVIPILCFLIFWWSSLLFTNDNKFISIAAFSGSGIGIMISLYLKLTLKTDIYSLSTPVLIMVYLFYSFGMFGFFMGVPIFHLFLGIVAGFYWTQRLIYNNSTTNYKSEILKISIFTSIVIGFVCLFSAIFALLSKSTPDDLKHMLHLSFDISQSMLVSFIITGGMFLILSQYWLTKVTMIMILKRNNINTR